MEHIVPFIISLLSTLSTISILGVLAFTCRSWVLERLKASIKHEYDLAILEIDRQREIRIKGEVVAELLAQWIRGNGKLDYYELNRLSFQAFLWLPRDLAEELSNSLSHKTGSQDLRVLIKNLRTHLQGENDDLKAKDIIVFSEPDIHTSFITSQVTSDARIKPKPK